MYPWTMTYSLPPPEHLPLNQGAWNKLLSCPAEKMAWGNNICILSEIIKHYSCDNSIEVNH